MWYLLPVAILSVTLVSVVTLAALGALCTGDFLDGAYTCNTLGSLRENVGFLGLDATALAAAVVVFVGAVDAIIAARRLGMAAER